jgi:hypothetical protein
MKRIKLFEEFSMDLIDQIEYGNPAIELKVIETEPSDIKDWFIKNGYAEAIINSCPANTSSTTLDDFRIMQEKMSTITPEDLSFARFVEKELPQSIIDFLDAKGKQASMSEYFAIDGQIEPLLFFLKDKINRPRPFQLSKYLGIPFYSLIRSDANSASYPGGHALTSFVVCEYYARKYPELRDELDFLANRIANSREQVGLHYPSDTEISRKICSIIWDNDLIKTETY